VAILRREATAGVSTALLHFADARCAAGVAVPPVWPAGKEPRNFGLDRDKQLAGVRQRAEIIQLPATTPPLADRTLVLLTGAPEGRWAWAGMRTPTPNSSAPHAPRSRRTEQELAWQIAVIPPAVAGVRRSDSRGSAIRKI
jgi:hypothetical protein